MKRSTLWIVIVVVAVIIAALIALAVSGKDKSNTDTNSPTSTQNHSTSSNTNTTPTATDTVTIQNFAFSPGAVTVKAGTKVTWTNSDTTAHTVTSDDGSAVQFDSGTLDSNQSYSFTFTKAGTYHYHCTFHPYMKGTVTVTE